MPPELSQSNGRAETIDRDGERPASMATQSENVPFDFPTPEAYRSHLDSFFAFRPDLCASSKVGPRPRMAMAPAEYLRSKGAKVLTGGAADVFDSRHNVIVLTDETAGGTTAYALLASLHELAHWQQRKEHPWLFLFSSFIPLRQWLEIDAWQRAAKMLKEIT